MLAQTLESHILYVTWNLVSRDHTPRGFLDSVMVFTPEIRGVSVHVSCRMSASWMVKNIRKHQWNVPHGNTAWGPHSNHHPQSWDASVCSVVDFLAFPHVFSKLPTLLEQKIKERLTTKSILHPSLKPHWPPLQSPASRRELVMMIANTRIMFLQAWHPQEECALKRKVLTACPSLMVRQQCSCLTGGETEQTGHIK